MANDWRNKPPSDWSDADQMRFVEHLMEPAMFFLNKRVLTIIKGCAGGKTQQSELAAANVRIAALESQLAESQKEAQEQARIVGMGAERELALMAQLAASREREGRMRGGLADLIGAVRHLDPCPATLEKAIAALAAEKEGE